MRTILALAVTAICFFYCTSLYAAEYIQVSVPEYEAKITTQIINDSELLISVVDNDNEAIQGLIKENFVIKVGAKTAKINYVLPLASSKEVSLNIVLVVDNSFSMKLRKAVEPVVIALNKIFETIRPIDNIYIVVFDDDNTIKVNELELNAKIFSSNDTSALREFIDTSFKQGISKGTYLYEAMTAGIDIIKRLPEKNHKFLVTLTDGKDLNSDVKSSYVLSQAQDISNFEAYVVDYMPAAKMDPFLESFSEIFNGRIWKAASATDFTSIFQSVTNTILHRYFISYSMIDTPTIKLSIEPPKLRFDTLTMTDGSVLPNRIFFEQNKSSIPEIYALFLDSEETAAFNENLLGTPIERYYNILNLSGKHLKQYPDDNITIINCNAIIPTDQSSSDLFSKRSNAIKDYLCRIWEVEPSRIKIEKRILLETLGQDDSTASGCEKQSVEIVFDSAMSSKKDPISFSIERSAIKDITVKPKIKYHESVASWEMDIIAGSQILKTIKGSDRLKQSIKIPINDLGINKLINLKNYKARIRLKDIYGKPHEKSTDLCHVTTFGKEVIHSFIPALDGTIIMTPNTITIEMQTTIDSSPLLNYVFFETGKTVIPESYITYKNNAAVNKFSEENLKTPLEKYYNILNILGKRLINNPDAVIKIEGCNSNAKDEKGKLEVSRARAEAVSAYLKYIWGIDSKRMQIKERNLPAAASSGFKGGKADNQRVEIYSETSAIFDSVQSTYIEEISDTQIISIFPEVKSGYKLSSWSLKIKGDGELFKTIKGTGALPSSFILPAKEIGLLRLLSCVKISAEIEVTNERGHVYKDSDSSTIEFILSENLALQKRGRMVQEKYALILFDFNQSKINERNKNVINKIIKRIKQIPKANVAIIGHTDNIGNEDYNQMLSEKRAKAAYDMILAGGITPGKNITYEGAGSKKALYENNLPEKRAFNRTVTVTLEYEEKNQELVKQ